MNRTKKCSLCNRQLPHNEFWVHKSDDRKREHRNKGEYLFPNCKECCQKALDYNDLHSILTLLKAFDVPYVEHTWNEMFEKWGERSIGRYLALMRLFDYYSFGFNDSDFLNKCHQEYLIRQKQKGTK